MIINLDLSLEVSSIFSWDNAGVGVKLFGIYHFNGHAAVDSDILPCDES